MKFLFHMKCVFVLTANSPENFTSGVFDRVTSYDYDSIFTVYEQIYGSGNSKQDLQADNSAYVIYTNIL